MPGLSVAADLELSVTVPDDAGGTHEVRGTLRGTGSRLQLRVDDLAAVSGAGGLAAARSLADGLAPLGVAVDVVADGRRLLTLGAVRSSWFDRRVARSRHIRVARSGVMLGLARRRATSPAARLVPDRPLLPPRTPFPLAPTFLRRRRAATTHDPDRGGRPRLVLAPGPHPWPGDRRTVFGLRPTVTRIGSGAQADIRLPGTAAAHAEIRHTPDDEFVLVHVAAGEETRVDGARLPVGDEAGPRLHTGTRLQIGPWTLSFSREEYADHGRPYGGRLGGEVGHQRPQPPRPQQQRPSF